MPYIRVIPPEVADGPLKALYDAAAARAGRIYNILRTMSPNPAALAASIEFYLALMYKPSPLARALRELIATVVSRANHCHY